MLTTRSLLASLAAFAALSLNTLAAEHRDNPLEAGYYWSTSRAVAVDRPVAVTGGTHHVYSCHPSDRYWRDTIVQNGIDGQTEDVVLSAFRSQCPLGSPLGGFEGASATISTPYDDSANPLNPAHRFH